jgi:hypothetical protein
MALVLGMAVGVGTCILTLLINYQSAWIKNGPWRTNLQIGSSDADPYTRAQTAVGGIYALRKEQAVYYMADVDSAGEPLQSDRAYRIDGIDLPARWWSLTVYGADRYLIANAADRYSFSAGELLTSGAAQWSVHLSPDPRAGHWLPSGKTQQRLLLCLRLYQPDPDIENRLADVPLPSIVRE